ncbi:MAG: hypothetical protein DMG41_24370 [Acidobacteria bacterium]|nr:MAG: hypothetical protein DMG42_07790 [Acidobacteriota bacterium]PYT85322.1 MAG: hypothetical protein DMG41_24370 [Acidobacteriota bacterium]
MNLWAFGNAFAGCCHQRSFAWIGQPSDGWDAVQMAKDLRPDLILLGLGLPKLHGLETAKRIRTLAPHETFVC